tara:strand:- start:1575 stop:1862 length:288 start_codon:yes stop_codon:yes gene_type:complete
MGLNRKLKRKWQNQEKKMVKKAFKKMSQRMSTIGDKCANCSAPLDKGNMQQLESWKVYQNHTGTHVVCPRCQVEIEELKRQIIEAENEEEEGVNA